MRTALLLLCCAALAACSTSNPAGDSARYRYPEAKVGAAKSIRFASTDGRFVGLSDGSLWNVDWSASGAAKTLRAGEGVRVEKSGAGSFPYRLTTESGRSVPVRLGKKLD